MQKERIVGAEKALAFLRKEKISRVDLQYTGINGRLHDVTIPADHVTGDSFKSGIGKLDGSSVPGFTGINESDMLLFPIPETLVKIPWDKGAARMLNRIYWGNGGGRFEKDPRFIAEETEKYQKGLGYKSFIGAEPEFFIFNRVDLDVSIPHSGTGYKITAVEAPWQRSGSSVIQYKTGYHSVSPLEKLRAVRMDMMETLRRDFGFEVEATHREVGAAGQSEINFGFSTLTDTADKIQTFKYVVKNVAAKPEHGVLATFMPKPMFGDNGSGMHVSYSLWTDDGKRNLMYDHKDNYAELSQTGRYVIGGLLEHAGALSAFVSPTVNSYHRLIPGFEAPVYTAWSRANRSAIVRVPVYYKGLSKSKRVEYRAPDPAANPYLGFSAVTMAALDGVKKRLSPGDPVNADIYDMKAEQRKKHGIGELPKSLGESLDQLERDSGFLKPVFGTSLLDTYVSLKREEVKTIAQYPNAIELSHYLDV